MDKVIGDRLDAADHPAVPGTGRGEGLSLHKGHVHARRIVPAIEEQEFPGKERPFLPPSCYCSYGNLC